MLDVVHTRQPHQASDQIPWGGGEPWVGWACPPHHPLACGPGHSAELSCPTLLQRHLHFSNGWKKFPQGQVSNHKHWKPSQAARSLGTVEPQAQLPAERRLKALCLPSTGVFLSGLGLPHGSNGRGCSRVWRHPCALWDAVPRKQKGLAASSTRDCAVEE